MEQGEGGARGYVHSVGVFLIAVEKPSFLNEISEFLFQLASVALVGIISDYEREEDEANKGGSEDRLDMAEKRMMIIENEE